ncbi:MAG: hypothetical protein ACM336_07165 [Acidobacteriota bacterium]
MRAALVILSGALLAAPAPSQVSPEVPELRAVLEKLGEYAAGYHTKFREFVASEERVQKHYGVRKTEQRATLSDYYVVSLPSAPDQMREFRETLSVDGREVSGKRGKVFDLLRRKSSGPDAEAQRFLKESKRYDLEAFRKFEEFTNLGLLYVDPRVQHLVQYKLEAAARRGLLVLQFRESGPNTVARVDGGPAPAGGAMYFTWPELRVVRVDLTIHDTRPDGEELVRCIIDYAPGPEGLMLPSRCRHFMPGTAGHSEPGSWESDARYSNYRRFTSDVKLTIGEPAEAPR